mmetsp:Transcript_34521/g.53901  ORF Transcript_34521/g.53901 Transcript_34521/m.53901 type:complete len:161 (-) Transcript_34521:67-549(-)
MMNSIHPAVARGITTIKSWQKIFRTLFAMPDSLVARTDSSSHRQHKLPIVRSCSVQKIKRKLGTTAKVMNKTISPIITNRALLKSLIWSSVKGVPAVEDTSLPLNEAPKDWPLSMSPIIGATILPAFRKLVKRPSSADGFGQTEKEENDAGLAPPSLMGL